MKNYLIETVLLILAVIVAHFFQPNEFRSEEFIKLVIHIITSFGIFEMILNIFKNRRETVLIWFLVINMSWITMLYVIMASINTKCYIYIVVFVSIAMLIIMLMSNKNKIHAILETIVGIVSYIALSYFLVFPIVAIILILDDMGKRL